LGAYAANFSAIIGRNTAPKQHLLEQYASERPLMYVTDTVTDILRCRTAGIKCCAVTWGFDDTDTLINAKPDWLVESVAGLEKLIQTMISANEEVQAR